MDTCKKPISLENAVERLYHACDKADRLEKKSQEKEEISVHRNLGSNCYHCRGR